MGQASRQQVLGSARWTAMGKLPSSMLRAVLIYQLLPARRKRVRSMGIAPYVGGLWVRGGSPLDPMTSHVTTQKRLGEVLNCSY